MPEAKVSQACGVPARRARTLPAAALALDRVLKRLAPDHVVFSSLGLREGWLYAQLSEQERYLDPLLEGAQLFGLPLARVPAFAPALVRFTERLFPGERAADTRLRLAVCALSDIGWREHPDVQAEEGFRRLLQFPFIGIEHSERVFVAAAIHARYAGRLDDSWLEPAIDLLPASDRRRAQILGRALLLGYRLSGGVPAILDNARVDILADQVRLEVTSTARVPDSEVVGERLKLLAQAIGVRGTEIVEA